MYVTQLFPQLKMDIPEVRAPESLCSDPIESVLSTLECIEREEAICAASGYADSFVKLHNGEVVNNGSVGIVMWTGSFVTLDFVLAVNHAAVVGPNQIRCVPVSQYIELRNAGVGLPGKLISQR